MGSVMWEFDSFGPSALWGIKMESIGEVIRGIWKKWKLPSRDPLGIPLLDTSPLPPICCGNYVHEREPILLRDRCKNCHAEVKSVKREIAH